MPKREDIEAQIAELQKQLDAGDDEYEIEIRDGDKAVRMPRSAGVPWLKKHFPDLYEELTGDSDDSDDDDKGKGKTGGKTPPKDNTVRFGRRVG